MPDPIPDPRSPNSRPRNWSAKFRDAFRGLWLAVRSERSFSVHLPMAAAVIVLAAVMRVSLVQWCLLGVCITLVLAAETFNTALERLAREIDGESNPEIAAALDMASGAVLVTAIGAAGIGAAIFLYRLGVLAGWWT
ncbi:MAG TPA: diacylglycerol kinase [Pirellulaceae bacterium]|nr:diacylglycerol kinase [Pirellulaceae bacterium]